MKISEKRLKEIIREEIENVHEQDYEKVAIPSVVKRWMNRFIDVVKGARLTRMRQMAILIKVVEALGITTQDLTQYYSRLRRGMKSKERKGGKER